MHTQLVAWLNSKRNYSEGVNLYKQVGNNAELLKYFLQASPSKASNEKLFEALRDIYYASKKPVKSSAGIIAPPPSPPITKLIQPALEYACKQYAEKVYKEMMNIRARLFGLCSIDADANENEINLVKLREKHVLELMDIQPIVQDKYDALNYVIENGELPSAQQPSEEALPTSPIALERMRVNLMKNIGKLRNKAQTPERVQLLNSHIAKLESIKNELSKF